MHPDQTRLYKAKLHTAITTTCCVVRHKTNEPEKAWEQKYFDDQIQARISCSGPTIHGKRSLLRCRRGVGCTFRWRCCCDYNCGNRLRGACCNVLLELLGLNGLDANLKKLKPSNNIREVLFANDINYKTQTEKKKKSI